MKTETLIMIVSYLAPMFYSWLFILMNRKTINKNSVFVIFTVSIIPVFNLFGAYMSFVTALKKRY